MKLKPKIPLVVESFLKYKLKRCYYDCKMCFTELELRRVNFQNPIV
jgi:hypothetical protein